MENKLLSFSEFENLYESFGFITEAEAPEFTPAKTEVTNDELITLFSAEDIKEAFDPKAFSVMKKGETSERVKQLQQALGMKDFGKYAGVFGDATDKAVRDFQTKYKLTVDGKVGVQTLRKMLELKGDKTPDKTIETKYVVKTAVQAKTAGIDPELLKLYDVTIVNNGEKQYVILIPKKDAAAKGKTLLGSGKFKGIEWLAEGIKYVGKALIYTATGVALATLDIAKAMISGIASSASFIAGGAAFVMGAAIQGIVNVGKWVAKAGQAAYKKIAATANQLYTDFCKGFAKVAKNSAQAFTAFMNGVKAVAYTATGIVLAAWKGVASLLSPAVKALVQGAKDGAAFVTAGMDWVAKNVKDGTLAIKKAVQDGWNKVASATQQAWNGAKSTVKSAGESMYKAANDAYNATASFLSGMYADGKKFWESLSELTGDPVFESADFAFEDIDFTIA